MIIRPIRFLTALTMFVALVGGYAPTATAQNANAATAVANSSTCPTSMNMYWEIGDVNGVIVSGRRTIFNLAPQRDDVVVLASASKWVLGAYMLEVNGGPAPKAQRDAARMLNGYPDFDYATCQSATTVAECFHRIGNHSPDPVLDGSYFYSGAHSQYLATDSALLDLGLLTKSELSTRMQDTLGISMSYQYPALSAGLEGSAASYAEFLKKLMKSPEDGGLVMHDYLGHDPVETLPCQQGGCSPSGTIAWRYADHYWIEDNEEPGRTASGQPDVGPGDGAFSSLGAFGFYPWITADKQYYGIIARRALVGTAYQQSITCGQAIRYAFTGYSPD